MSSPRENRKSTNSSPLVSPGLTRNLSQEGSIEGHADTRIAVTEEEKLKAKDSKEEKKSESQVLMSELRECFDRGQRLKKMIEDKIKALSDEKTRDELANKEREEFNKKSAFIDLYYDTSYNDDTHKLDTRENENESTKERKADLYKKAREKFLIKYKEENPEVITEEIPESEIEKLMKQNKIYSSLGVYENEYDLASGVLKASNNGNNLENEISNNQIFARQLETVKNKHSTAVINKIHRSTINNPKTISVMRELGISKEREFNPSDNAFYTLLGTPNGTAAAYLFIQNGAMLGLKSISKIKCSRQSKEGEMEIFYDRL